MAQITLKGSKVNTIGELPKVGTFLTDFMLVNEKLEEQSLKDFSGKNVIFNIFPSIDTGVCAASARSFNEKAGSLENTLVVNVSKDLPFALGRFCASEGLSNVLNLSDFRGSFGDNTGVTMADSPLKGLLSRAVIIIDTEGKVIYTEQVPEIASEPNYDAVLEALK